jgi:inorganic triphosphatase YgiF
MSQPGAEFELKFQVPRDRYESIERALRRGSSTRRRLQARYFDTPQRALERAGIVLRLRKEGRDCVQTVKAAGAGAFERLEHEVPSSPAAAAPDLSLHDGSAVATLLQRALASTGEEAAMLQAVYTTDVIRLKRTITAARTSVEVALDRGQITAAGRNQPVLEVEFELKSGQRSVLVELARSWSAKHGLWLDPQSKSAAARRLAAGNTTIPPVKATEPQVSRHAPAGQLMTALLASVLEQVLGNAREVAAEAAEGEHVHQLRVGLRRLRSLLGELRDLPEFALLEPGVEDALLTTFRALGRHRDGVVLVPLLHAQITAAGAPAGIRAPVPDVPDIAAEVRAASFQLALLDILGLHQRLLEGTTDAVTDEKQLRPRIRKRLTKLHRDSLLRGAGDFARLPEPQRHRIRKRLKRLRYLSELMRSLFTADRVDRFIDALKALQDELGEYQDAVTGRRLWSEYAGVEPTAWFGAGWLAAREQELALRCERACRKAAKDARLFWKR